MVTKVQLQGSQEQRVDADSPQEWRAGIFISHSRKDKHFVGDLKEALEKGSYDVWVDVEDILPTEDWLAGVYSGIEGADAFVFVISPDSIRSDDCQRELDHAVEHNKRLVPIMHRPVPDEEIPEPLRAPEWIFFRDGDDFDGSLQTLTNALDTDLVWLHAHTRLLMRAIEWEANGRDKSFVLHGSDLRTAEEWQVKAADKEPKLTALQSEYILASRQDATRRQRITLGAVIIGLLIAVVLSVFAWSQRNEALEQRNEAVARQLAAQSELVMNQESNLPLGVLLAVESMRRSPSLEADQDLRSGLTQLWHQVSTLGSSKWGMDSVIFSSNGHYVAGASGTEGAGDTVRVWEAESGEEVSHMPLGVEQVATMTFSPDGRYLTTVSRDGSVQVWEVESGEQKSNEEVPPEYMTGAATFSLDGGYFASVSSEGIRVWDVEGQISRMSPGDQAQRVTTIAFSPDRRYLAAGSGNGTIEVWEVESGKAVSHKSLRSEINDLTFSPDGHYLAAGSSSAAAQVWEVESGKEVLRISLEDRALTVAFSPDGRYLAVGSADGTVELWDAAEAFLISRTSLGNMVNDLTFSPDGRYLATATTTENALVWMSTWSWGITQVWEVPKDPLAGGEVSRMALGGAAVSGAEVEFSPDGRYLTASSNDDNTVPVWEVKSGKEAFKISLESQPLAVAFSPDGRYLATTSWLGSGLNTSYKVQVSEVESGNEVSKMTLENQPLDVAFSPDERYLAIARYEDNTVRVWEVESGEEVPKVPLEGQPLAVAFIEAERHFVEASTNNLVWVQEAESGEEISRMALTGDVTTAEFSPDGRYLATGSSNNAVRVREVQSGEEISHMSLGGSVQGVEFSPDGRYLATRSSDNIVRIWEVQSGEEVSRMSTREPVDTVDFSPDGRYLATGSWDHTARVWEVESGREISRVSFGDLLVSDVEFSPDGRYLATGDRDQLGVGHLASVWYWQPPDLIDEACQRLARNLTKKEWHLYLPDEPYRKTCPNLPEPE